MKKTSYKRTGLRGAAAALIVMGAVLLASCGQAKAKADGSSAQAASENASKAEDQKTEHAGAGEKSPEADKGKGDCREVDVVLDWYPNAIHCFLYNAIEKGYYEAKGLKVNVRFPANDNDGLALVAAGKAAFSLYYQQDVIQAVTNQNIGIKSVGAVCQTPLNIILSLKDKGIRRPSDLAGKTVGYGGTALSEAMVRALMRSDGADPDSVTLQNVGFDLMSAMTTGQVDATIGCLVNHEVPQLEEEGFELSYFPLTDYGMPNFYELCLLTNQEMIEKEPEVVRAFLDASKQGFEDFQKDPEGSLRILLEHQNAENFPLSPTVEAKSAATLLPLMEQEGKPFLSQMEACWQDNIDWMYQQGLIERKPAVEDVMQNFKN